MPRALSPIALLVVLFLLTAPSVRAEDAPRSAEQLIATLPAPSAQQAFRFEGSMRIKGAVFMNLELSVTPAAGGLWQLRERRIGTPDSRGREDIEEAVVDARLGLRQGVVRRLGPLPQSCTAGVLRELRWGVSQGNLVVQDRRGQRAPALAVRTPAFTTIAQTAYLLRHIASDRKVRYRVDYLKVRDPAQGGARLEPALQC